MSLADQLSRVRESIASACARRGRSPQAVRLLAATKTVPPERIREAFSFGLRLFGENRVQERQAKQAACADLAAEWHLLGPLQSNKAARALELFDAIESLDSMALAQRLSRLATRTVPVFLEVNIGHEPQKHGFLPEAVLESALAIQDLTHIEVHGLMAVPPATSDPEAGRPYFAALAELGERVRQSLDRPVPAWELSMGMSHDFAIAIEEGATIVRLGTALFGARTDRGGRAPDQRSGAVPPPINAAQQRLGAPGPPSRCEHKRDARRTGLAQLQPGPGSRAGARAS